MSAAAIALNRFGLGARRGEVAPDRPRAWLLDQLARFEPLPPAIAALPPSGAVAGATAEFYELQRRDSEQRRERGRQARQRARGAAGSAPPAMAGAPEEPMMAGGERDERRERGGNALAETRGFAQQQANQYHLAAAAARAQVALTSPTPFAERLVHFWANHFAISVDKQSAKGLAGPLEFEAIRPHLTGTFGAMLQAVERHAGMLVYLDQASSVGPHSAASQPGRRRRPSEAEGLSENLAREILELHTLGVRSGYDQADVTEFAAALTGWTASGLVQGGIGRFVDASGTPGSFVFAQQLHEPGTRIVLGRTFPQPGEGQASAILDMLASHPATARHLAAKLARHFAGDVPPPALADRLEAAFLESGGDLASLYRVLVEAPECWVAQPVKFRTPWEWSIGAMRALGTEQIDPQALHSLLRQLGQPVWQPGSPAGWDDAAASWAAPDALMRRVEAAERMAGRTSVPIDARALAAQLHPGALSATTTQAIARAESPGQALALLLVAPEAMRR